MGKGKLKIRYILGFMLLLLVVLFINLLNDRKPKDTYSDKKAINTGHNQTINFKEEDTNSSVLRTAAGFYLYDSNNQPVYRDQEMQASSNMELNIECVNICEVDLKYTLVILMNDCYQNAEFTSKESGKLLHGKGQLQAGASEKVNVSFEVRQTKSKKEENEIRVIMFYYPNKLPQNNLQQVPVGGNLEIHKLVLKGATDVVENNEISENEIYPVDKKSMKKGIWLTVEKFTQIPKFDFILDLQEQSCIYFNSIGNQNIYYGMIFVDGTPILVQNDYVFEWKQKENALSAIKVKLPSDGGESIFAYMYEAGTDRDGTYTTNMHHMKR